MSKEIIREEWADVLLAAKGRWPELDVGTVNIIPTEASKVMIPVIEPHEIWPEGDWIFRPPVLVCWVKRRTFEGRLWRPIGKLFGRRDWRRRGMSPIYRESRTGAEEIPLERVGEFEMGYGPLANVLAVRAFPLDGYWYPVTNVVTEYIRRAKLEGNQARRYMASLPDDDRARIIDHVLALVDKAMAFLHGEDAGPVLGFVEDESKGHIL